MDGSISQPCERAPSRSVFEADPPELDAALERRQVQSVGGVLPVGLGVEQPEHAFGPCHGRERLVVLVRDRDDGREEGVRQEQELNQRLELYLSAERLVAARHQQDRQEQLAVELEQRQEHR